MKLNDTLAQFIWNISEKEIFLRIHEAKWNQNVKISRFFWQAAFMKLRLVRISKLVSDSTQHEQVSYIEVDGKLNSSWWINLNTLPGSLGVFSFLHILFSLSSHILDKIKASFLPLLGRRVSWSWNTLWYAVNKFKLKHHSWNCILNSRSGFHEITLCANRK